MGHAKRPLAVGRWWGEGKRRRKHEAASQATSNRNKELQFMPGVSAQDAVR
jgi:hypothetical protein